MSFTDARLDKVQRTLSEASAAISLLNGELTVLKLNKNDAASVEVAIIQMEEAVNAKLAPYQGNILIEGIGRRMKEKCREQILEVATGKRGKSGAKAVGPSAFDPLMLRQIENTVEELREVDFNSFARRLKKLSRLLHSNSFESFTQQLIADIDIDAWLEAGRNSQSGLARSAAPDWPTDAKDRLGTVTLLVDRFVEDTRQAYEFALTYYYNGKDISSILQNMTGRMIIPFCRDYTEFVRSGTGALDAAVPPPRDGPTSRKVFVVPGQDEGAREAVAHFLEKLHFEPIVLHERAVQERTIIERIEAHGDVGFAVVLLTPDDVNVILELGYFVGRLGRSRVCALKRGNFELPSVFGGVAYENFDAGGGWKTALGRTLSAAGFEIARKEIVR
ncbi:TIR domain-containing protein [Methylocystis sp.]|uniref:TIR domain-containing protein n=1 Tax=Methylocystis sp. TaxID=1911079 RepID=UPI003D125965